MRIQHTISALAVVLLLPLLGAAPSVGCEVSSARVTGEFGTDGGFRVTSAVTADGQAMPDLAGKTLATVSAADRLTLPAADLAGKQIWLIGDVDGDAGTLAVSCWTHDEQTAKLCGAHPGSSSCASASATAKTASSSCCATTGKARAASSAGCGTAGKTQTTSSSCSTSKGPSARSASAGCGISAAACGEKAASAGCGTAVKAKAKAAKATTKAKATSASAASCAATCATPCGPSASAAKSAPTGDYSIVYSVSGMTCNACVEKVRSAVADLKLDGVRSVDVDLENNRAVLDCTGDVNRQSVQKAITAAGFPAELIVKASTETSAESVERS